MIELIGMAALVGFIVFVIVFQRKWKAKSWMKEEKEQWQAESARKIRAAAQKVNWLGDWPDPVLILKLFENLPKQRQGSVAALREEIIAEFKLGRPQADKVLQVFRRLLPLIQESKAPETKK